MTETILVVDDERQVAVILAKFLSNEGFKVMTANDGESAIKIAKEASVDLIVMDVMMPGMDGGDVMSSIMKDEQIKNIPIVFLTGLIADDEVSIYNENFPGRIVLSKALDIEEQVKAIKKVLEV